MNLEGICRGRRVLFVNSIRTDQPSGGNSSSTLLRARLRAVSQFHELNLGPDATPGRGILRTALFVLASMPAVLMIALLRQTGQTWLEFFIRCSPWYALRCLAARRRYKPQVVVFNHHPTFPYMWLFGSMRCVLLWHDVPSLKRDSAAPLRRSARRCAWLERRFIARADSSMTFSFSDARFLRRMHRTAVGVLPVVQAEATPRSVALRPTRLLLVGNWRRAENADGALDFFERLAAIQVGVSLDFHVAGAGADDFVQRLRSRSAALRSLPIHSTGRYGELRDFDAFALLAPLSRGAGIKLKTIEAWCAGIPVVGTPQAFTGMSPSIWSAGGIQARNLAELVDLCLNPAALRDACAALEPLQAFRNYQDALERTQLR
jgi:hypothetical protein